MYPEPPEVIVTIPMVLSPINAVPAAPDPPEPLTWTVGARVYPRPGFVITIC